MPRPKAVASLSESTSANMDGDSTMADAFPTPESDQENAAPKAKGRGRGKAAASAITKAKPKPANTTTGAVPGKQKPASKKAGLKFAPLKEQSSNQNAEDTEEVDDFEQDAQGERQDGQSAASADELVAVKQPAKKARSAATGRRPASKKTTDTEKLQQVRGTFNDGEFEYTPVTARQTKPSKKGAERTSLRDTLFKAQDPLETAPEKVIPDTQDIPMETEPSELPIDIEEDEEIPRSVFRRTNNERAPSQARQTSVLRKQAGAGSDTEHAGDPALRRKLGEMTKKFESLDVKYKRLTDVGIKDAEANFERLRLSSEAKSKGT